MRCVIGEDSIIKLRQEGIFLCLDGSRWSQVWKKLYDFLALQCKHFDTSLKLGMLSWMQELEAPPEAEFLTTHSMANRGRFLTPLVEEVFPNLGKNAYNLFILSSETIYDYEDWTEELEQFFNAVLVVPVEELERKTEVQLEEYCLQHIFRKKFERVTIFSHDSVCYDIPKDSSVTFKNGILCVTKAYSDPFVDIPLKTFGINEYAALRIEGNGFTGECQFKNTTPELVVFDAVLCETDCEVFSSALEIYAKGDTEHYCSLCEKIHKFSSNALLCRLQKSSSGGIFSQSSVIFRDVEKKRCSSDRYVLFKHDNGQFSWMLSASPILPIAKGEFLIMTEQGKAVYVTVTNNLTCQELTLLHKGLFATQDREFLMLTL